LLYFFANNHCFMVIVPNFFSLIIYLNLLQSN